MGRKACNTLVEDSTVLLHEFAVGDSLPGESAAAIVKNEDAGSDGECKSSQSCTQAQIVILKVPQAIDTGETTHHFVGVSLDQHTEKYQPVHNMDKRFRIGRDSLDD